MACNVMQVLRVCMAVHGYEIFIDGVFNGDPHPGNILLMPDGVCGPSQTHQWWATSNTRHVCAADWAD
jgi:predicted unusual protein kinase regulating ubiquinone biosynthesis (AarF/ABC1/UbiB family)